MQSPGPKPSRDLLSALDNDLTLINPNDANNNNDEWTDEEPGSDDDAYFHWEEEATLFSDLLEEAYDLDHHFQANRYLN